MTILIYILIILALLVPSSSGLHTPFKTASSIRVLNGKSSLYMAGTSKGGGSTKLDRKTGIDKHILSTTLSRIDYLIRYLLLSHCN